MKAKKKSYLPKMTKEEEVAESMTKKSKEPAEEEGEAILPKKQKRPGKQIMDAVGKSLLKPRKKV